MSTGSYHHGALRETMLEVAEGILERDGPDGLTLRAAARAAGVSHSAPAHHFGDLIGLLTELAAVGYRRFADQLTAAANAAEDEAKLKAIGIAYVQFARAHPSLFLLMFRGQGLDKGRPSLSSASEAAFAVVREAVRTHRRGSTTETDVPGHAIAAWSLVHGFAMLMIDGRLPRDISTDKLLDSVLTSWRS